MNFVCIVFELGDKMLKLSSMENLNDHVAKKQMYLRICYIRTFKVIDMYDKQGGAKDRTLRKLGCDRFSV